jgi:methionyl-tRNA formyltransferase
VDEEYDTGSILAQWPVPVRTDDTPESLAARVLKVEHILYPRAAEHLCRAVERGESVKPLTLPGDALTLAEHFSSESVASQIDDAFRAVEG